LTYPKLLTGLNSLIAFLAVFFLISCHENEPRGNEIDVNQYLSKAIDNAHSQGIGHLSTIEDLERKITIILDSVPVLSNEDLVTVLRFKTALAVHFRVTDAAVKYLGDFEEYISNLKLKGIDVRRYETDYYFLKGDLLNQNNEREEAYYYYFLGKENAEKTESVCELSNFYYRMAKAEYNIEKYENAVESFKKSLVSPGICEPGFRYVYRQQERLSNVGLSFYKLGENDSSIVYYKKALNFLENNLDVFENNQNAYNVAKAVIQGNLSKILAENGDLKNAEKLALESIQMNLIKEGDIPDGLTTAVWLAGFYNDNNQLSKADSVLNSIKNLVFLKPHIISRQIWIREKYKNNELKDDLPSALEYLNSLLLINDSINKFNQDLKSVDLRAKVETLSDRLKLEQLAAENEFKILTIRATVILLIILGILLILFSGFYFRSVKQNKKLKSLNSDVVQKNLQNKILIDKLNSEGKEKDRILRTVAHDLRNPIAALLSLTELMAEEVKEFDNAELDELIGLSSETCNNALILINEILEVVKTKGNAEFSPEKFDFITLCKNVISTEEKIAFDKKIKIKHSLPDTAIEIIAEKDRIARVITNILSNATKFSFPNSEIYFSFKIENNNLIFWIQDAGIGIPDELKSIIFEPFTTAKRPGTEGERTFGLGLSICKQIIERHNGEIWFESEKGKGSTFFVTLPIKN
jgi:signal transduction histidine kinase